ncbi:MAG: DNA recombination protein RmuC, partial [Candidatus Kerfeldbacteria bacterium]|nr:DNA recombination protein RmuC [Candidatus Kerfeldbacteria bacterium]
DGKLGESTRMLQAQFGESAKIIRDVTERLTKLDETNRQVVNFADQLQNLQDILKNPKQRGILGEYYLETLLKNVLPAGSYQMQYPFKDGTIVDAVVFVKDKIIPIDSKFSLENYNRLAEERDPAERERLEKLFKADLKNRIDETSKYVKPEENTMDFAFMFIPHEAIYYDLLVAQVGAVKVNTRDLIEYAFKDKHVIIVSPTSFLAYLQTVLQGLRALQIEESAKEIRKNVETLAKHLLSYDEYMKKLGSNLGTTVNSYNSAYGELKKIDKDVLRISGEAIGIEVALLDKPKE